MKQQLGRRFRPSIEVLEGRLTPANVVWQGDTSNLASDRTNWQGDNLPGVNDVAVLDASAESDCVIDTPMTFQGLSLVGGANAFVQKLTLNANLTVFQTASIASGTIAGTGNLIVSQMTTLSGGTFSGARLINSGMMAQLFITGNVAFQNNAYLENNGSVRWQNGAITLNSGALFLNKSTFWVEGNNDLLSDGTGEFKNQAMFGKMAMPGNPVGTTTIAAKFNNQALPGQPVSFVSVSNGSLTLTGGGTQGGTFSTMQGAEIRLSSNAAFTLNQGTVFQGMGVVRLVGDTVLQVSGGATVDCFSAFEMGIFGINSNPTISGQGTFRSHADFSWFAGSIADLAQFQNLGFMEIDTVGQVVLDSSLLTNSGTLLFSAGILGMNKKANPNRTGEIRNTGTFTANGGSEIIIMEVSPGVAGDGLISNFNQFNVPGSLVVGVRFRQYGQITVPVACFLVMQKEFIQSTGQTTVTGSFTFGSVETPGVGEIAGGTLLLNGGSVWASSLTIGQMGRLVGTGTVRADELVNLGVVEPNFAATLNVIGTYTQGAGGTLRLWIGNNNLCSRLFCGTFNAGGVLMVNSMPGSTLAVNNVYHLIVGQVEGDFASKFFPVPNCTWSTTGIFDEIFQSATLTINQP